MKLMFFLLATTLTFPPRSAMVFSEGDAHTTFINEWLYRPISSYGVGEDSPQNLVPIDFTRKGNFASVAKEDCSIGQRMDLANWSHLAEPHTIHQAWRSLFTKDDDAVEDSDISLAKGLIYNGFTHEARLVLSSTHTNSEIAQILTLMADAIDGDNTIENSTLVKLLGCDVDADLWVILTQFGVENDMPVNYENAINSFMELPQNIATETYEKFLVGIFGKVEPHVYDSVLRDLRGKADSRVRNIDLTTEYVLNSTHGYLDIIPNLTPGYELHTEYLASQFRHSSLDQELKKLHILELIRNRNFVEAFYGYNDLEKHESDHERIFVKMVQELTRYSEDITFLSLFFALTQEEFLILPLTVLDESASRLRSLGFDFESDEISRGILFSTTLNEEKHVDSEQRQATQGNQIFHKDSKNISDENVTNVMLESLRTATHVTELHLTRRGFESDLTDSNKIIDETQTVKSEVNRILTFLN